MSQAEGRVAAVLIGRNEGERLVRALAAAVRDVAQVVYVDSGSTDDSVSEAEKVGAQVVTLDMAQPFTAARARNAGFAALRGDPAYVMFIDGDCALIPGFIAAGVAHLDAEPPVGLVCGWTVETAPEASIYNALCAWEWKRPAGVIDACGGIFLIRAAAWRAVGGMTEEVIAAEDDELCCRLRKAGWLLERLPMDMVWHDADMHRFGQWWRRTKRAGHGFAQVGALHPEHFLRDRQRAWLYGLALPLGILAAVLLFGWPALLLLGIYPLMAARTFRGLRGAGLGPRLALANAGFLTLGKFPNLLGMLTYHLRRLARTGFRIIEYK